MHPENRYKKIVGLARLITGFYDIVQRHGSNAVEAQAVVDAAAKFREMERENAA